MNTQTFAGQATGAEPAGGAAAGEAIGATAAAGVATALIALLITWHRSGRIDWLARVAAAARRATGLPEWAALPVLVLNVSLLTAVLGMYWDISLHIDNGRDPGPLANPAHYLILVGLYGVLLAGVLSAALADAAPEPHRDLAGRRLVGPGRRRADRRLRRVRAVGLPAGRRLAPAVRAGRHALGPDPPDADRRRLAGDARRARAPVRGDRRARARPGEQPQGSVRRDPPQPARGQLPGRPVDLPGRVRLRGPAVPRGAPARADHARRRHRARHRPHLPRPRRGADGRARLPRHPRSGGADGRRRVGPDHAALPALPGRGGARRGGLRRRRAALSGRHGGRRGRPARHYRSGGGVGLEPRLDAAALDRLAAARRPRSRAS